MEKAERLEAKVVKRKSGATGNRNQVHSLGGADRRDEVGVLNESRDWNPKTSNCVVDCGFDGQHGTVVAISFGLCPRAATQFLQVQQRPTQLDRKSDRGIPVPTIENHLTRRCLAR